MILRVILAVVALCALATAADAKPRKARVASAAITCNDRGCSDWAGPSVTQRRVGRAVSRTVSAPVSFAYRSGSALVREARRHLGATARDLGLPRSLWCADFMNMALRSTGRRGTGSRLAASFASYGPRVSGPQVGAIAVMSRGRRGGHVGVVSGIDASGNPIIISGNHNRRVAEAVYPRGRIYAYVLPRG
jgi:uncharacterized protein (TIGR02594 family)